MKYDVCIVGAGIVGLAHAYWASKYGLKVIVVEKNSSCQGASVRNFGLFWEIGQEKKYKKLVSDSKLVWMEFINDTNSWYKPNGSLGIAYNNDELELIHEYCKLYPDKKHHVLSKNEIQKKYPFINNKNLKAGLYSENEITINSRESLPLLVTWLKEKYKVDFIFGTTVISHKLPKIQTNTAVIDARKLIITTGADFECFFPSVFKNENIVKCKLHMLKTRSVGQVIKPAIYSATSFIHYSSFSNCKSIESIKKRINKEEPLYLKYGINLLIAQNNYNQLIIGDSHEYSEEVSPFNNEEIDKLIISGINKIIPNVQLDIIERWHGVYAKSRDKKYLIAKPEPNVLIVNALAGAGMTLSFGLAKKTVKEFIT